MHYIVLDLEWNQALSRETVRNQGFPLMGEIIQIGAVRLLTDGTICDSLRLIVSPKYYRKMHWNVRKLTGITTEILENGIPFPMAYEQLMAWCGEDFAFLTWGPDDIPMLHSNLRLHGIDASGFPPFYDLQKLFHRTISSQKQQWSLADALQHLGIQNVHPPHDALNDALNAAMICPYLPMEDAIAHYHDMHTQKTVCTAGVIADTFQYASYEDMIRQNRNLRLSCTMCGQTVRPDKWVRRASGKRITIATCPCGAKYLISLRWKEDPIQHSITAHRIFVPSTEEQESTYRRAIRKRRKPRKKASVPEAEQMPQQSQPV